MTLFDPIVVGAFHLRNRCVMAPLARARCNADRSPGPLVAEYYAQRANAGLIVTEACSVSPLSVSRPRAAAQFTDAHEAGWRQVAARVHLAGGFLVQQLYHLGRKADPTRMPDGTLPVSASDVAARGQIAGLRGLVPFATPRPLATGEVPGVVAEFAAAAARAKAAGMDGIEIHAANGYLIDQFLRDNSNRRTDRYGGPVANRVRFLAEIAAACCAVFGPGRVGARLSPHATGDGIGDSDPHALYGHVAGLLNEMELAYVHLIEATRPGLAQSPPAGSVPIRETVRQHFHRPLILNGGFDHVSGNAAIAAGQGELISFGQLYIANPDLVERLRHDAPLNPPDTTTFHHGDAKGYTDYPAMA